MNQMIVARRFPEFDPTEDFRVFLQSMCAKSAKSDCKKGENGGDASVVHPPNVKLKFVTTT